MHTPYFSPEIWDLFGKLKVFFGGDDPRIIWADFPHQFENDYLNYEFTNLFFAICIQLKIYVPKYDRKRFIKKTMGHLVPFIF